MSRILVIETDSSIRAPVHDALSGQGHTVECRTGLEESLRELSSQEYDVVVSELSSEIGLPVLKQLALKRTAPRPIAVSSQDRSPQCDDAEKLGAVCVLQHPFSTDQLLAAVRKAEDCKDGFRGRLHGFALVDLLQMFHYARRSVSIMISDRASVHMSQGELVHAAIDEKTGQDALTEILMLKSGFISTEPLANVPQTISRYFQSLLLDALRECDESERHPQTLGTDNESETSIEDPFGFGDLLESMSPPQVIDSLKPPETAKSPTIPPMSHLLSAACAQLIGRLEQGVGAAVIDLNNERPLGMHWIGEHDMEAIVEGAIGMLQTRSMLDLECALNPNAEPAIELTEFRAASARFLHFAKLLNRGGRALILVVERGANPGLCWAELRRSLPTMERALP